MADESKAEFIIMPRSPNIRLFKFADKAGGLVIVPAKPGHRIVVWSTVPLRYEYKPMTDGEYKELKGSDDGNRL